MGLFLDNLNKIFGTVFGQSETVLRFGFDPGTDVFGFCGVFWYPNNSMTNYEGTKRCPVVNGFEILAILYVIVRKIDCCGLGFEPEIDFSRFRLLVL